MLFLLSAEFFPCALHAPLYCSASFDSHRLCNVKKLAVCIALLIDSQISWSAKQKSYKNRNKKKTQKLLKNTYKKTNLLSVHFFIFIIILFFQLRPLSCIYWWGANNISYSVKQQLSTCACCFCFLFCTARLAPAA